MAAYASESYLENCPPDLKLSRHRWIAWDETWSHLAVAKWMEAHIPDQQVVCLVHPGLLEFPLGRIPPELLQTERLVGRVAAKKADQQCFRLLRQVPGSVSRNVVDDERAVTRTSAPVAFASVSIV